MSFSASLPALAFLSIELMGKPMLPGYPLVAWNHPHVEAEAPAMFWLALERLNAGRRLGSDPDRLL